MKLELANLWKLICFGQVEDQFRNVCRNVKKIMKSLNISSILAEASSGNVPDRVQNVAARPFFVEKKTKKLEIDTEICIRLHLKVLSDAGVSYCFCFEMLIEFSYLKICQACFSAHPNHLYHDTQENLNYI